MNTKITFKLAAFVLLGLPNATDARAPPVGFPDLRGQENTPPALDDAARGVLRAEVQHLGVESPALRGRDDASPALDDVKRGASRADVRPLDVAADDSHAFSMRADAPPALEGAVRFPADPAGRAAEPSSARGDSASEQDCIIRNIDFGNSTVGALMTRGFPLFTDFGLDMGKIGDAYFELEPMYEINMANWEEYTAGNSSWQVWQKTERDIYGGSGGNGIDSQGFLYPIGYTGVMNGALLTLAEAAFDNLYGPTYLGCSLNSYCREAGKFARSVGAEPPEATYGINIYSGPLNMRTPFNTDFDYTDQDGIKFTEEYLETLEALPEVYDRETYLAFGRRFGLARSVSSIQFSNTDVFVAGEEYITMGSKNYEGQECVNPEPGGVTYTVVSERLLDTFSPIQKARFETLNEIDNQFDMVRSNTLPPSPTASPTLSLSPTASPSISPNLSLAPSPPPVVTPTSGSQTRTQSALMAVFALVCNLIM